VGMSTGQTLLSRVTNTDTPGRPAAQDLGKGSQAQDQLPPIQH